MKKKFAILLTAVLLCSLATPAFAKHHKHKHHKRHHQAHYTAR